MSTGIYSTEGNDMAFAADGTEIMKFCPNGDIFVKGKLVKNDMEAVETMLEFAKMVLGK